MVKLPKPTPPPVPKKRQLLTLSNLFAATMVFFVIWQLVAFADFAQHISAFLSDELTAGLAGVATLLIMLEVFSLPFLLQMRLSPLARLCSAACLLLVPVAWSVVTLTRNDTMFMYYALADMLFILWAAVSFWELGGNKALVIKRR